MKIGEAASMLGVSPDSLKRWEQEGRIPRPRRTCGGWRLYTPDEVKQLMLLLGQQVETERKER